MNRRLISLLIAVVTSTVVAFSAFDTFLKMDGIEGDVVGPGRTGVMEALSFSWGVSNTPSAASGLPTGKRQHKPISVSKIVDKATPKLFEYCCKGTHIPTATITCSRQNASGGEEVYLVITFQDVVISGYTIQDGSDLGDGPPKEMITFVYQKIEFEWVPSKEKAEDNWKANK